MKITFIRPNMNAARSRVATEPLVFAVLAGQTPPDIELVLYDERIEDIPFDESTDLVAITVATYTARRAYEIATSYRYRGVPVVLGGIHPTFLPNEGLLFADAVVIGDAERLWQQVVSDATRGRLQRIYRDAEPPDLTGVVFDRSIFAGKSYSSIRPVQFGRGCRYACEFCCINALYGSNLRQRQIRDVVAEIEALEGGTVFLVDDNLFVNPEQAGALFRALKPLGVSWLCQASIDITADEHLLDSMVESGCIATLIGFESLNTDNLRQMQKQWSQKQVSYEEAVRRCRSRGLLVYGTFIFGYDGDQVTSFDATVDFALREKLCLAEFFPLTPMPGAPLYDRMRREGRLLHERWWLDPAYRYGSAMFVPCGMSADDLTRGCFHARRRFTTYGSILRRVPPPTGSCCTRQKLGFFLGSNFVLRREVRRRQGMPLGTGLPIPVWPGPITEDLYAT